MATLKWPSISERRSPTEKASSRIDLDRTRMPTNGQSNLRSEFPETGHKVATRFSFVDTVVFVRGIFMMLGESNTLGLTNTAFAILQTFKPCQQLILTHRNDVGRWVTIALDHAYNLTYEFFSL